MRSRVVGIVEPLPISPIVNLEFPGGIPKSDPTSVRDTAARGAAKVAQAVLKYQRDGWKVGEIEFNVNPGKSAVVCTVELTRWD